MSIRVMTNVWEHFPGKGTALLAMLAFADWSDDHGRCFPSMSSVAARIRLSRSQAQRVVHGLIDSGFIKVIANKFGGDPGKTRVYQIQLSMLASSVGATGSADATGRRDAQEGSHDCDGRGRVDATQTVNESSRTTNIPSSDGDEPAGFTRFWQAWPRGDRKQARGRCLELWRNKRFESAAQLILTHVERMKQSQAWQEQGGKFIPAPLSYLGRRNWEGAEVESECALPLGVFV